MSGSRRKRHKEEITFAFSVLIPSALLLILMGVTSFPLTALNGKVTLGVMYCRKFNNRCQIDYFILPLKFNKTETPSVAQ